MGQPSHGTKWILGVLGTVVAGLVLAVVTGFAAWLTHINSEVRSHGEKLAVQESQMIDVRRTLDSMNHKLDRLLEDRSSKK